MKSFIYLLILLQCSSLVFQLIKCEEDSTKKLETPDGLVRAEELALEVPKNHKLGTEEYYGSTKHFIPFDKIHFDFDSNDWSVYKVPQSKLEEIMITISPDISKELKISTIVRQMSDIILTYQIHMASEEAPLAPTFSVYLITNGTKELLIEESPQEKWKTTSLQIKTKKLEAQLLFVGVLRSHGNKIALRSFTFQDKSDKSSVNYRRYGELPKLPESEDILTGTAGHGNTFFDAHESLLAEHPSHEVSHFPGINSDSIDKTDELLHTSTENTENQTTLSPEELENIFGNSSYSTNASEPSDYTLLENTEFTHPNSTDSNVHTDDITDDPLQNLKPDGSVNVTQPYSLENWTTSTAEEFEIDTGSSISGGIFNFFIVIIICATVLIAFLMWRRRRNQRDDEIPVFSRTSIEHGNPTFNDIESNSEATLQRDSHSNYKSFE